MDQTTPSKDTLFKERDKHEARSSKFLALTAVMAGGALISFVAAPELSTTLSPELYAWVIPSITAMTATGYVGIAGAIVSKFIKDNTSAEETRPFRQRLIEKMWSHRPCPPQEVKTVKPGF